MAETLILDQPTNPNAQGQPLSPDEQRSFDELAARAQAGQLTLEEQQAFDQMTAPENYSRNGVEPTVPTGDEPDAFDPDKLKMQVVDISQGVHEKKRDVAQAHINRETTEIEGRNKFTRFTKGLAKKIWKGNIARDHINLRQQRIAQEQIVSSGNLHIAEGGSQAQHDQEMGAVVSRIANDALREGEVQQNLAEINNGQTLESQLKELIVNYAQDPDMSDDALNEAKTRMLKEFGQTRGATKADRGKGLLFADNILEVARNARAAARHQGGLERVREALTAQHTEARTGANSQVKLTLAEKVFDKLYKSRFGSWVNESTVGAVVSIPLIAGKLAAKSTIGALTRFGTLGAGTAVIAGARERLHIQQERQTHMREMAQGGGEGLATAGKRREKIETTRYETVKYQDLVDSLDSARDLAAEHDNANGLREALNAVVEAHTRMDMSDRRRIDLVEYSSKTTVEQERWDSVMRLAAARAAVQGALTNASDDTLSAANITGRDLEELLSERSALVQEVVGRIEGDMSTKDAAFNRIRRNRMFTAGLTAAAVGSVIGLGTQELKAALDPGMQGVFASHEPGETRQSLLASMFRGDGSGTHNVVGGGHGADALTTVNGHSAVNVPNGYHLQHDGGKWELFDSHHKVIDNNVTFDAHGHLTDSTRDALTAKGFQLGEYKQTVTDPTTMVEHHVKPHEYINHHKGEFTSVHRELWYDNDTPNTYDKNELNLWWGGQDGTGVDAHGNYVFSVANMNPDGSYHDGLSANAQHLIHEGKMKIALSVTDGTQNHVIMVDVNEHGQAVIDKDSFAGKTLFTHHDGQTHFTGAYAEAVQLEGEHHGVQNMRMLATVVGDHKVHNVIDHIPTPHSHEQIITSLTPPTEVTSGSPIVEVPPVVPIVPRAGLESAKRRDDEGEEPERGYIPGVENMPASVLRRLERDRSPRLRDDSGAQLQLGEELNWHDTLLRRNGSPEYVRDLEETIANTPALREIGASTKAIVTIPVGAALESDNIYHTLSLYGQQSDKESLNSTLLLLHVNWIDDAAQDPIKAAAVEKTKQEIERARQDYPDLRISTIESVWSREKLNNGGYGDRLIGHVSQKMYDAAMMAVNNAVNDGRMQPTDDVLVIKNDADALGMDHRYLAKMIRSFEEHPENDVFTGAVRWGTHRYPDLPGFGYVTTFLELTRIAAQMSSVRGFQSTFGVNAAIRMSTFAAVGGIGHYSDQKSSAPDDLAIGERVAAARNATTPRGAQASAGRRGLGRRRRRDARRDDAPSYGSTSQTGGNYDYHRHVIGADIDTDADRMEGVYAKGLPITSTWDAVNAGGGEMSARTAGLATNGRENLRTDSDGVVARIENNISALITLWMTDPKQVATGLAFMTPGADKLGGKPAYKITKQDGRSEFRFTAEGKKWLVNSLQRNSKGQFDSYGVRKRRILYSKAPDGARIQPNKSTPRLLGGIGV